jgi:hypothetical protein
MFGSGRHIQGLGRLDTVFAMVEPASCPAAISLRVRPETVLQVPLSLVRYRQPMAENGPLEELVRLGGPCMPQDHVLHRNLSP